MIVYKDILRQLKQAGYNSTTIMREKILSQATVDAIRHNRPITLKSIDIICHLLHCQPNDIMEHIDDQPADQ